MQQRNPAILLRAQTPLRILDRSLTYRRHLESLRKKLTSRVALLRQLPGSGWGAGAITLRIVTLALVHSTAEYCTPAWCRSAHTRLIDPAINDALQIVTGCLRPTPADLPILAGIQPVELRRNGATLSLARRAMDSGGSKVGPGWDIGPPDFRLAPCLDLSVLCLISHLKVRLTDLYSR